jgi:chemotaxis protein CheZ
MTDSAAAVRAPLEREPDLLAQLADLTVNLRTALDRFRLDSRITALAEKEIPDARQRLTHVLKLTEAAAHRTLDLVERSGPIVDQAARDAADLLEAWGAYPHRGHVGESLWPERAHAYLERALKDTDQVRGHLSEMLMAQGYQDITGQIIRSVIALVGEIEAVLGQLVALSNGEDTRRLPALKLPDSDGKQMQAGLGPQVPGVTTAGDAVAGQDDIDALLASMAGGT